MTTPIQIIFDFVKEMINRIATKSPAFFKVLIFFTASLTFAGYIPSMLQQWFNVEVSGGIINFCESVSKYATGALVVSGLTVKTPTVGITSEGSTVKVTDEKRMPFTAAAEQKAAAKEIPPPEVLPEVPEKAPEQKIDISKFPPSGTIPTEESKDK